MGCVAHHYSSTSLNVEWPYLTYPILSIWLSACRTPLYKRMPSCRQCLPPLWQAWGVLGCLKNHDEFECLKAFNQQEYGLTSMLILPTKMVWAQTRSLCI